MRKPNTIIYISIPLIFILGMIILMATMEGFCSDISEPRGAIEFAYEHMVIKENITFTQINPNPYESVCERHYWVTDTEGNTYRLVWSKMHNEIELNKSYSIHYLPGTFNALWEVRE